MILLACHDVTTCHPSSWGGAWEKPSPAFNPLIVLLVVVVLVIDLLHKFSQFCTNLQGRSVSNQNPRLRRYSRTADRNLRKVPEGCAVIREEWLPPSFFVSAPLFAIAYIGYRLSRPQAEPARILLIHLTIQPTHFVSVAVSPVFSALQQSNLLAACEDFL